MHPKLEIDKIKTFYQSFDSGKLASTIVNLDMEELCQCFAQTIIKHIEHNEENEVDYEQYIN